MSEGSPADVPDYSAWLARQPEAPAQGELAKITELARESQRIAGALAEAEAVVAELKAAQKRVDCELLPEAMNAAKQKKITTEDGHTVELGKEVSTSCAEGRVVLLAPWLIENGYEDVVKRAVTVSFGRGEDKQARTTLAALVELHGQGRVKASLRVESSTLNKLIRDRLAEGKTLPPPDVVIVTELLRCKVKVPEPKD